MVAWAREGRARHGWRMAMLVLAVAALVAMGDARKRSSKPRGRARAAEADPLADILAHVNAESCAAAEALAGNDIINMANRMFHEGRREAAATCLRLVTQREPDNAAAHVNLGTMLSALGHADEARDAYFAALDCTGDVPVQVYGALARQLFTMGEREDSLEYYALAAQHAPHDAEVQFNYASALMAVSEDEDDWDEAVDILERTVKMAPTYVDAYVNLGNLELKRGRPVHAIRHLKGAHKMDRARVDVLNNLAIAYERSNNVREAAKTFKKVAKHKRTDTAAYMNWGVAARKAELYDDAVAAYTKCLDLDDAHYRCANNLGNVYKYTKRYGEAVQMYKHVLAIADETPIDVLGNLLHCLQFVCDWDEWDAQLAAVDRILTPDYLATHAAPIHPFYALSLPLSAEKTRAVAESHWQALLREEGGREAWVASETRRLRRTGHRYTPHDAADDEGALADVLAAYDVSGGQRLRVAYVSSNIGNHSVSFLTQHLFHAHDRAVVEVWVIALNAWDGSPHRRRIERTAEHFVDASRMSDDEVTRLVEELHIHVLVNMNGHTKGSRHAIFARRPAPVQVLFLGYVGTMGAAPDIGFVVTDPTASPPDYAHDYAEKLLMHPHSFLVNDASQAHPIDAGALYREDYGIPEGAFVFCNFNQLYKTDRDTFAMWMRILQRVPGSVLWLLRFPAEAEPNIRRYAADAGVAAERLLFTDLAPHDVHIRVKALADLFLDTPKYNAHTSAVDILWAGVPMISMPRRRMSARVGASALRQVGLGELIVRSAEEYEDLAVALATQPARLAALREELAHHRHFGGFFNMPTWVAGWERTLRMTWEAYVHGRTGGSARGHHVVATSTRWEHVCECPECDAGEECTACVCDSAGRAAAQEHEHIHEGTLRTLELPAPALLADCCYAGRCLCE